MVQVNRIAIIGMPAAGKTSVGKLVTEMINEFLKQESREGEFFTFLDTDAEIEKSMGRTLEDIFESKGEETFREQEHLLLKEIIETDKYPKRVIVATGGGMVTENNVELFKSFDKVLYLKASLNRIAQNIQTDKDSVRPLIKLFDNDPKQMVEYIRKTRLQRHKLFEEVSTDIFQYRKSPIEQVAGEVFESLRDKI